MISKMKRDLRNRSMLNTVMGTFRTNSNNMTSQQADIDILLNYYL